MNWWLQRLLYWVISNSQHWWLLSIIIRVLLSICVAVWVIVISKDRDFGYFIFFWLLNGLNRKVLVKATSGASFKAWKSIIIKSCYSLICQTFKVNFILFENFICVLNVIAIIFLWSLNLYNLAVSSWNRLIIRLSQVFLVQFIISICTCLMLWFPPSLTFLIWALCIIVIDIYIIIAICLFVISYKTICILLIFLFLL